MFNCQMGSEEVVSITD